MCICACICFYPCVCFQTIHTIVFKVQLFTLSILQACNPNINGSQAGGFLSFWGQDGLCNEFKTIPSYRDAVSILNGLPIVVCTKYLHSLVCVSISKGSDCFIHFSFCCPSSFSDSDFLFSIYYYKYFSVCIGTAFIISRDILGHSSITHKWIILQY